MAKVYSVVALTLWLVCSTMGGENPECRGRPYRGPTTDCCDINLSPEQIKCLQEIREKWMEKRKSSDKENDDTSDVGCGSDCFFSTDIATSDNEINANEVKVHLDKILGDEWQTMIPNMIETCKGRATGGPKGHKGHKGRKSNCNPIKEKFLFCIHEQILEHCPDSKWKNGDQCNNARTFLKNCPFEQRFGGKRGKKEE